MVVYSSNVVTRTHSWLGRGVMIVKLPQAAVPARLRD